MLQAIFRAATLALLAAIAVLVYVNYFRAPVAQNNLNIEHADVESPPALPHIAPNPEAQTPLPPMPEVAVQPANPAPAQPVARSGGTAPVVSSEPAPLAEVVEIPGAHAGRPIKTVQMPAVAQPAPARRTHTVAQGDSLWVISRKYLGRGDLLNKIAEANNISGDRIRPGQILVIPDLSAPALPAPAATTAAARPPVRSEDEADHEDMPRMIPVSASPATMNAPVKRQ